MGWIFGFAARIFRQILAIILMNLLCKSFIPFIFIWLNKTDKTPASNPMCAFLFVAVTMYWTYYIQHP